MEKEKKSIQGNLPGRSILYGLLMTCALALVAYLIQYGFFYLNIVRFENSPVISLILMPFILFAFLMAVLVTKMSWGKGKILWNQWQRRWALDSEEKRVLRLMDNSTGEDTGSQETESSEQMQSKQ